MSNNNSGKVEEIKEAVRDGLANHSGEFANPWIFKGSYSHELLADILNDIMASERIFKNLDKLISSKVNEEVIKERKRYDEIINLYGVPQCNHLHHPKKFQHSAIEDCPVVDRIRTLKEKK